MYLSLCSILASVLVLAWLPNKYWLAATSVCATPRPSSWPQRGAGCWWNAIKPAARFVPRKRLQKARSLRLPAFVRGSVNAGAGEVLPFHCVSPVDSHSILLLCTLKRNYGNSLGAQTSHICKSRTGMLQIRISSLAAADASPRERGHPLPLWQRSGNLRVLIESKLMSAAFKCQGCGNTASSWGADGSTVFLYSHDFCRSALLRQVVEWASCSAAQVITVVKC